MTAVPRMDPVGISTSTPLPECTICTARIQAPSTPRPKSQKVRTQSLRCAGTRNGSNDDGNKNHFETQQMMATASAIDTAPCRAKLTGTVIHKRAEMTVGEKDIRWDSISGLEDVITRAQREHTSDVRSGADHS